MNIFQRYRDIFWYNFNNVILDKDLSGTISFAEPSFDMFFVIDDMTAHFCFFFTYVRTSAYLFLLFENFCAYFLMFLAIVHACASLSTVCTLLCMVSERYTQLHTFLDHSARLYIFPIVFTRFCMLVPTILNIVYHTDMFAYVCKHSYCLCKFSYCRSIDMRVVVCLCTCIYSL